MKTRFEMRVTRLGAPLLARPDVDWLAEEVPVAFEYNGISQLVMLATPCDFEDFAVGLSLSEGLVERSDEIFGIEVDEQPAQLGVTVKLAIAGAPFARLKERRRTLAGRTGCGICGVESLEQVRRPLRAVRQTQPFSAGLLRAAMRELPRHQTLQRATGATHAACFVTRDGSLLHPREDVGRHNALDKTLGALVRAGTSVDGALIITSRASFEMVQKCAALGHAVLAAVSAPTAAAVRLADEANVCLVGFLRGDECVVYSHPERLETR